MGSAPEKRTETGVELPLEIGGQHRLGGGRGGGRRREILHELFEEELHETERSVGAEDHEGDPAPAGSVEAGQQVRLLRSLVHDGAERFPLEDRKSTRLNSSHSSISYA